MDKIIVNPSEVRGLGDVVSPKSVSDYIGGKVSSVGDGVFELEYLDGSFLTLTVPATISGDDETFDVSGVLKKADGTVFNTPEAVVIRVNETTKVAATNTSTGAFSMTFDTDGSSRYDVKVYYTGSSTVAGTVRQCIVQTGSLTGITLTADNPVCSSTSPNHLIATVTGEGRLAGNTVEYLAYNPILFKVVGIEGVTDTDSFYAVDGRSATTKDSEGTLITGTSSSLYNYWIQISNGGGYNLRTPYTIDFDVISQTGVVRMYTVNNETHGSEKYLETFKTFSDLGATSNCHIRIVGDGETLKYYVDDELVDTVSFEWKRGINFGFRGYVSTLKFKNFVIGGY